MILYIGNKLSKHGNTPTSVETLGTLLSEDFNVLTVSDKKNKLLRLLDMCLSIVKYRKDIDFILIDTYSTSNFYYALICAYIAKFFTLPYIPILHGGNLPEKLKKKPILSNFLFANSYTNVAPSGYLQDAFEKEGYNVMYIPNTIEIKNYEFIKRSQVNPKLLYVRAFSKPYNPMMALDVLQILLKKYPNSKLCMVGPDRDGTLDEIKKLCHERRLDNKVVFTGKLSKEEWWSLSKEYDIFINTTNVDNTPVSLIEAMALGLPVVTTNVGGIPYLVKDGIDALIVPPKDAKAMSKKIELLIEDQNITLQIINNGRKKAESFDWVNVKPLWLKLFKEGV